MEESKIRDRKALERLYLVVALAVLFATTHGMTIQSGRKLNNWRDRNPYYSDFNTLLFPFSLAIPTKEYAVGIRDRVESNDSDEEE
ncbi:MAG: hypothetical protein AAGE96_14775 [Cyanobacteria bacterium P01_G01_bin.19]